ncbi:unnamed protein product [Penicillium pancosmium]
MSSPGTVSGSGPGQPATTAMRLFSRLLTCTATVALARSMPFTRAMQNMADNPPDIHEELRPWLHEVQHLELVVNEELGILSWLEDKVLQLLGFFRNLQDAVRAEKAHLFNIATSEQPGWEYYTR